MDDTQSKKYIWFSVALFLSLCLWWGLLQLPSIATSENREIFSSVYGVMALWGGLWGIYESKKWGGTKSVLGKAVLLLSIGLLLQVFGQVAYSAYTYILGVEIPYPSIGDVGYFGSIFFYIGGAWYLASIVGIKYALDKFINKLLCIAIPVLSLVVYYFAFFKVVEADFSHPLVTFLNFGYPFGQSVYLGISLVAIVLSRTLLGGTMKPRLSLLLFSLLVQYASDFVFLLQTNAGTWVTAGFNELMYLSAYFLMTMSLVSLDKAVTLKVKQDG